MLYKFAAALGFTAFFMMKVFTDLIKFASQNMTQFAFSTAIKTANPILSSTLGLDFFFPALFLIVCLAAGCVAAEVTFNVIDMGGRLLAKDFSTHFHQKSNESIRT